LAHPVEGIKLLEQTVAKDYCCSDMWANSVHRKYRPSRKCRLAGIWHRTPRKWSDAMFVIYIRILYVTWTCTVFCQLSEKLRVFYLEVENCLLYFRIRQYMYNCSVFALLLRRLPIYIGDGVLLSIDFFVSLFIFCFFVSKITRKRLDRFAWNFKGRCGVTTGRPDSILDHFRQMGR